MLNRRRWGASVVRVRVLAAALLLLAAGCMVLGWGSRSRQSAANSVANLPALQGQNFIPASPVATMPRTLPSSLRDANNAKLRAVSLFSGLPLMFEPNQGQGNLDPADRRVKFLAQGSDYGLLFGADGAILTLRSQTSPQQSSPNRISSSGRSASRPLKRQPAPSPNRVESIEMKLAGANPNANLTAGDRLPGKTNYLLGNDPAKWRRDIPQFARLRYENVYPGINLVFYGNHGHLEYDFQVAPGADPAQAELEFHGAKQLELQDGALVVQSAGGDVRFDAPRVYQLIAGRQEPVEGKFVLRAHNRAGFAIGSYDHSRELVIDPVLNFSTFFGGTGDEHATSVAVDVSGKIYLTGSTTSPDLLTLHPGAAAGQFPSLTGAQNVYIAKIDQTAHPPAIDYITYLGGSGQDSPVGIAVDAGLNPMVAGTTTSPDFPHSTNAYQSAPELLSKGPHHVFVTRFDDVAQNLIYSSYLSGNGDDIASGMTIDNGDHLFVTGTTTSTDVGTTGGSQFPATSATSNNLVPFQSAPLDTIQFFVTEVDTNNFGNFSIPYSTYFGGGITSSQAPVIAKGGGIAVDSNGNIYFDGTTNFIFTGTSAGDFPIKNAYQPCLDQPPPPQPINPPNCANNLAFPDAFVAKLFPNPTQGSQLQWSTYIGGDETDSASGIALDTGAANVYVVGTTNSQLFTIPTTIAPFQVCLNNLPPTPPSGTVKCTAQTDPAPSDAFIARFNNPTTTTSFNLALTYFSYLGGPDEEDGLAIAVDTSADALVTGLTKSPNLGPNSTFPIFPSPSDGIQNNLNGPQNAFVARINTNAVTGQNNSSSFATYFGGNGTDEGTSITLDGNQNLYFAGDTNSTNLQVANFVQQNNNGRFDAFVTKFSAAATLALSGQLQLGTNQTFISAGNPATFIYTLKNNGPDVANNITVTDTLSSQGGTGVTVTPNSAGATNNGTCTGVGSSATNVVCTIPQLQSQSIATITIQVTPTATAIGNPVAFNGGLVTASASNSSSNQVTVTAQMSDYTISANPNNFTVLAAGDPATYQIELIPHPVYGTPISLSANTGNIPGVHTSFSSASVSLASSSSGGSTLTISTTPRPIVTPAASLLSRHFYAVWLGIPGLALIGLGAQGRRRRRILGIIACCAVFCLILLQPACSHGNAQVPAQGTPAGTYTITITATSGSDTKSTTVTLTVP